MHNKIFKVVLVDPKNDKRFTYSVDAHDFSSAASDAYIRRHSLSSKTNADWYIISLTEEIKDLTSLSKCGLLNT